MVKVPETNDATVQSEIEADGNGTSSPEVQIIEIPHSLGVRQLAELLQTNPIEIIKQLMRIGIMANINHVINYETAAEVVKDLGYEALPKPRITQRKTAADIPKPDTKIKGNHNLEPRPPVVTVMGHVDHGKTKLLDVIRKTNVMDTEAGSITQHIGAYQVTVNDQKITFLDTPGHEAFTAMRAHGAQITDITILVVAADDGVMPQTVEAINHAQAAEVPIIVAINKIDKENANPDLVKQQLADAGLLIEEWGGKTISVPISAKEQTGIPNLLENLLLMAEMEELKADPSRPATGVVIEAEMDKSRGPLATVLIQNGALKLTDIAVVGTTWGRVRAMFNDKGQRVKKAESSTPIEILGLNIVPQVGDILSVPPNERQAQTLIEKRKADRQQESSLMVGSLNLNNLFDQISTGQVKDLNLILKTDVQGSIAPIKDSLDRLSTDEVQVKIIHSGTGNVTESDIMLAIASKGIVIGFGVGTEEGARRLASTKKIDIRNYNIIYSIVDDVGKALEGMLEPTYLEIVEGHAEVRAIFSAGKRKKIAGAYVTDGNISHRSSIRVRRGDETIVESTLSSLRRFKDDVKEVVTGYECGIGVKDFYEFQIGDLLESFKMKKAS